MAVTFSHSLRSLNADSFRRSVIGLLLAVAVLGAWVGWALFARVTLYEVTDTARLEVGQEAHPHASGKPALRFALRCCPAAWSGD